MCAAGPSEPPKLLAPGSWASKSDNRNYQVPADTSDNKTADNTPLQLGPAGDCWLRVSGQAMKSDETDMLAPPS